MKPGSAVDIATKSEAQALRSEGNGSLPLRKLRAAVR